MSDTGERFKQGTRLLRAGKFASAADVLRQFTEENPDDSRAFEALGAACFAVGDNDGALKAFRRATELMPQEARVFVNLGAVYNRRGEYQAALDALRKSLQKDRKSADAYYNMGLAHRGLQQTKMAVSAYREAIRLSPEMAEAYQNLGHVYNQMGNFAQAVTNYQRALELRPQLERAQQGLQQAKLALENQKKPDRLLNRLGAPSPKTAAAADGAAMISAEDLELIRNTAVRAGEVADELAANLTTQFDRALKDLNKAVTRQGDAPLIVDERLQRLRDVVGEIVPRFQEVDVRVRQIETLISGEVRGK